MLTYNTESTAFSEYPFVDAKVEALLNLPNCTVFGSASGRYFA